MDADKCKIIISINKNSKTCNYTLLRPVDGLTKSAKGNFAINRKLTNRGRHNKMHSCCT